MNRDNVKYCENCREYNAKTGECWCPLWFTLEGIPAYAKGKTACTLYKE